MGSVEDMIDYSLRRVQRELYRYAPRIIFDTTCPPHPIVRPTCISADKKEGKGDGYIFQPKQINMSPLFIVCLFVCLFVYFLPAFIHPHQARVQVRYRRLANSAICVFFCAADRARFQTVYRASRRDHSPTAGVSLFPI